MHLKNSVLDAPKIDQLGATWSTWATAWLMYKLTSIKAYVLDVNHHMSGLEGQESC